MENCFNEMLEYGEAIKSSFIKGHVSDWPENKEEPVSPETGPETNESVEEPEEGPMEDLVEGNEESPMKEPEEATVEE